MKKKIKIVVFVLLMIIMTGCVWNISQQEGVRVETSDHKLKGAGQNVGEIDGKVEIAQTFEEEKDFQGIALLAANYDREMFGTIHLELYDDETNQKLLEKDYDGKEIKNDKTNYFIFDEPVEVSEPHRYRVVVSADMKVFFSHFTLWHTGTDKYPEGALYINGEEQGADLVFDTVYSYEKIDALGMKLHRSSLVIILFAFLGLHCFVDIRKMYQWIFEKRVWVALGIFVFMVANKYNFSSMAEYDAYIETEEGSQYASPVAGDPLAIRSDEWMVSLPRLLSAEYSNYGEYNSIVRAEKTTNLSASGLYRSYSALAQPSGWGYYLFGSEYGTSFMWCFNMVFGFFFSFELCLILTKRKPLLALLGGSLIWFSSYNMWWSTVNWLLTGQAALVCFYYFLVTEKRWKKAFCGVGTAIFAAAFVVNLYPAWQVPAGYVYLCILIWMLVDNREKLKEYKWKDWLIGVASVVFMVSIIGVYLKNDAEYLTDIMNTVYPGTRVSYGGFSLNRLLGYLYNFWMPFSSYGNPSEAGCFVTLFPIPYLLALVVFFKNKKKDLLTGLLMAAATILGLYCIFPLPHGIAKVLLLTYSFPGRVADILGYLMILLLLVVLGRYEEKAKIKLWIAAVVTGLVLAGTLAYTQMTESEFMDFKYYLVVAIAVFVVFVPIIADVKQGWKKTAMVVASVGMIVSGLLVNPLMCGLDAIYSKPVAKEIQKLAEENPEARWLAVDKSGVSGNFLIACGAPTVNSVNYVPNMKLWEKLDPTEEQEEVYNRYAHIVVTLNEKDTNMSLRQADVIDLSLSKNDLEKLDITYLYSNKKLTDTDSVHFEKLYHNKNAYIYQAVYQ